MRIRPGLGTRIVIDIDVTRERILVKDSTVYDVQEPTVILAQTDPPILKSMLHKTAVVTYLVKEKTDMIRHGFTAELVEFIDYNLNSGEPVKALVVKSTGPEKPYNIRMFYRVEPISMSNVSMSIFTNSVNIIDISLGGVKFTFSTPLILEVDNIVQISIEIDGKAYAVEARILRTWQEEHQGARRDLWFASAEFVNVGKPLEYALLRKIQDIERESRQKEMPS